MEVDRYSGVRRFNFFGVLHRLGLIRRKKYQGYTLVYAPKELIEESAKRIGVHVSVLQSGLIADREESRAVLPEHVREAQEKTDPRLRDEDVSMLPEEKLILLALARSLKRERESIYLPFEEVESVHHVVSEEYGKKPVGRVLLHAFIKNLEAAGVIILSEKFELGLDGVKAEILEKFLMDLFF